MDLFSRLRQSLSATRAALGQHLPDRGVGISPEALEEALLVADVGIDTAEAIGRELAAAQRGGTVEVGAELGWLKGRLEALLGVVQPVAAGSPHVVLVVGVNGTGKTTSAAKLAVQLKAGGHSVILCAADTFRAAAIEQLQTWGERIGVPVVTQRPGADPGAVVFDALQAASSRRADAVIIDTAGRLHTKQNLMAELDKVRRVCGRAVAGAPHEVLLVLDANTGTNGVVQAREFRHSAGVTGVVLTKLDGTAKGGVVLAVTRELGVPVRWVGVGEGASDLVPFDSHSFVSALLEGLT